MHVKESYATVFFYKVLIMIINELSTIIQGPTSEALLVFLEFRQQGLLNKLYFINWPFRSDAQARTHSLLLFL